MKSGVQLIIEERQQQLVKHNYSISYDVRMNPNGELVLFAGALLKLSEDVDGAFLPPNWDPAVMQRMLDTEDVSRYKKAGALIAAEIDRLQDIRFDQEEIPKIKELASSLNGLKNNDQKFFNFSSVAKEKGLVIVYGLSDDTMRFRGAIEEDYPVSGGRSISFLNNGRLLDGDAMDMLQSLSVSPMVNNMVANWCSDEEEGNPDWSYYTDIYHERFDLYEDDDLYCRGIVFSVKSLV